ncbi:MAG: hypothetical protein AMK69_01780 [Nitrospira bacterium SG8_3]|nr:MAG: hypothetical protein AMK69_01780 [Nitrospira bacterium SG8_3]
MIGIYERMFVFISWGPHLSMEKSPCFPFKISRAGIAKSAEVSIKSSGLFKKSKKCGIGEGGELCWFPDAS